MYRRYYDGYNNYEQDRREAGQGEVVVPRAAEETAAEAATVQETAEIARQEDDRQSDLQFTIENGEAAVAGRRNRGGGLFDRFELDDLILIGVLILMLQDAVDDTLLLVVLGFIFLVGFMD